MSEESKGLNARTWNAISVGVLLLAVALGIILYVVTEDILSTFATILLVYGVYMAASRTPSATACTSPSRC